MSRNKQVPLGTGTQQALLQIKADSSQEAFPPCRTISRSTIFRSKMVKDKKKFNPSKAGNK